MPEDNKKEMAVVSKEDFSKVVATAIANLMKEDRLDADNKMLVLLVGVTVGHAIEDVLFTTDEKEKENV